MNFFPCFFFTGETVSNQLLLRVKCKYQAPFFPFTPNHPIRNLLLPSLFKCKQYTSVELEYPPSVVARFLFREGRNHGNRVTNHPEIFQDVQLKNEREFEEFFALILFYVANCYKGGRINVCRQLFRGGVGESGKNFKK